MYALCPDCETALDQSTGICPACRWDPILSLETVSGQDGQAVRQDSYRAVDLGAGWPTTTRGTPVSKVRALVIVGLLALVSAYWLVFLLAGKA